MHAYEHSHTKKESRLILLGNPNVYPPPPIPEGFLCTYVGAFPLLLLSPPPTCEWEPPPPLQLCSALLIFQVEKTAWIRASLMSLGTGSIFSMFYSTSFRIDYRIILKTNRKRKYGCWKGSFSVYKPSLWNPILLSHDHAISGVLMPFEDITRCRIL